MALKRIIPCLLFNGTGLVKTTSFKKPEYIGDPINAIKIFNDKEVDELIFLDINCSKEKRKPDFSRISEIVSEAFMPFTYGGGVKSFDDFATLYKTGVEKIVVNSLIHENPKLIQTVAQEYGSQAIVGCIDYKKNLFGKTKPYSYLGHSINYSVEDYAKFLSEELGIGEIMLQNVDREGSWEGLDIETTDRISNLVKIPVITTGGCGKTDDIKAAFSQTKVSAVGIGSMAVYSKKGMGVLINFPNRELILKD